MGGSAVKAYRGMGMEGFIATWYTGIVRKSIEEYRTLVRRVAAQLAAPAGVLDLAPGPGFFAIELAKLGSYSRAPAIFAGNAPSAQAGRCRFDHRCAGMSPTGRSGKPWRRWGSAASTPS